jgi:hypothetical protein
MSIESQLIEALRRFAPVFAPRTRRSISIGGRRPVRPLGPPGTKNASWGDFAHFMQYTAQLNPWAPAALIPTLAWVSTAAELVPRGSTRSGSVHPMGGAVERDTPADIRGWNEHGDRSQIRPELFGLLRCRRGVRAGRPWRRALERG